jgi:hypothetical protein
MGSVTDQDRPRLGHLSEPRGDAEGSAGHIAFRRRSC